MASTHAASSSGDRAPCHIHPLYRLAFLYLEPLAVLAGAYLALLQPTTYLATVHALPTSPTPTTDPAADPTVKLLLAQLANIYVLFPLLEHTVLRAARGDARVWRALLRALLVADLGHLAVVATAGVGVGWGTLGRVAELGVADWGKPVCMVVLRGAFLAGWGVREGEGDGRRGEGRGGKRG